MAKVLARGLAVLVGVALALPAQAVTIQYVIEGVVSGGTWASTGLPGYGVFQPGTASSLHFEIDSATAETPLGALDPGVGSYPIGEPGAFGVGELWLDPFFPLTLLGAGMLGAGTPVLSIGNASLDSFGVFADVVLPPCDPPGPTCPEVPLLHSLTVFFGQTGGGWFDSDAIPTELSLPPEARFVPRAWEVRSSSNELLISFSVTSLHTVPEAGTLPLVALASLLIARASVRGR